MDITPLLLDGKALAARMREDLARRIENLKAKGCLPGLGVILVGDDSASASYVGQKEKACREIGINSQTLRLPSKTTEHELLGHIDDMNHRPDIHGFLVQLPLPRQIRPLRIIEAIDPRKDTDGFHPANLGKLLAGDDGFIPCTPHGIVLLLECNGIAIAGKEAVIVGRSNIVGKPLALLLLQRNATVTVCHTRTTDLSAHTRRADILVAAVGKAGLITGPMVKKGAVVVDVGSNRTPEGKLCGDVVFTDVASKTSAITPVPGGVGPMTVTMLLYNTILAAERKAGATA